MKPEKPRTPRQELEASLTALLLGELPAEKAAALQELMAKDTELARLYARLEQTVGMVRETAVPAEQGTQSAPSKLSTKRREQLLANFKTVAPKEFTKPERRRIAARELAIAAGFVALIGVGAWFTFTLNSTQYSFSSVSRIGRGDVSESAPQSAALALASPQGASLSDQRTRLTDNAWDNSSSLAGAPSIYGANLTAGGGGGDIGRPSQTIFDREPAQQQTDAVIVASAGKPIANQIVLPTATDFEVNGKDSSVKLSVTNYIASDPQWTGALERGNYSPGLYSTNQVVSRELDELSRRQAEGLAWSDNMHSKQGNEGLAGGVVQQMSRSKLQEGLRNSSAPVNKVPVIDPATGLPVPGAFASGSIDPATGLPIPTEVAEGTEKMRGWFGAGDSNAFFSPEDLSKRTASQAPYGGGGTGGGGGGGPAPTKPSEQLVARTLREPALAPAQPPTATSPAMAGEKLAEVAEERKDVSGSNIYLGRELVKADVKFGTWSFEAGQPAVQPGGTKNEEEKLKQIGEARDGAMIAGEATTPGLGFSPLGPKETPPPSGISIEVKQGSLTNTLPSGTKVLRTSIVPQAGRVSTDLGLPGDSQGLPLLGDLPTLGQAFKGTEAKPDSARGEAASLTDLYFNPPEDTNLLANSFFYVRGTSPAANWIRNFTVDGDDYSAKPAQNSQNTDTLTVSGGLPAQQGPSNVYGLHVVGYYNVPNTGSIVLGNRLIQSSRSNSYDRFSHDRLLEQRGTEAKKETKLALNYANSRQEETKSREAQTNAERLREQYQIADTMATADAPAMIMSAETVRKLEGMRIELETQVMQQETQLDAIKKMSREKLVYALLTATPDTHLKSLLEQKTYAEQALILKQREVGESSPEVTRLRSQISDLNSKIDQQADGILANLDGRVAATKEQLSKLRVEVEKAKTNDTASAKQTEPYWEAKRKLDDLQRFSQVLAMKIASENIEASLPKTTMVEIMDDAVPAEAKKTDVWDRIRGKGKYESQARIKVERDQSDISFMTDPRTGGTPYDPHFIQNEVETIKSDKVLGNVVTALNLQKGWAKGGQTLGTNQAIALLRQKLELTPERNSSFVDIAIKSDKPEEAAELANAVARAYQGYRLEIRKELSLGGIKALETQWKEQETKVATAQREVDRLRTGLGINEAKPAASRPETNQQVDAVPARPAAPLPIPQPEIQTSENTFSTFSLNVSDVAFKLAAASLEKGQMPEPAGIRSEEFINAFDYRDPEAPAGVPVAFAWERARYPYAQNRDLLRFSIKTAAQGRQAGRPLNLVLLMDNSGSMERSDRVAIIREALKVLASQLQPQDKLSVITFARTAQLRFDGVPGNQAAQVAEDIGGLTPEGGTNIEEAMNLAYQTALRHYLANGINRVVLLTDGAANLGNVEPESLKQKVEANRKQGVALDCFGIGWEGLNDDLLETLSRNGDGRYGFINSPEEAATEFAGQLAGALNVAASDVKVQVEFNPARVTAYRQIGYAKHQLTKEQFRDNTVDAAEIAAQEAGNALYVIEVNPAGQGPLGTVRVRFKVPGTFDYREHEWSVPFNGNAVALEQATPAMRLAATASAFSEWLATSPYATEVTPDTLLSYLSGVPEVYGVDGRPKKLEWMIRQAKSLAGGEIRNSTTDKH
jgi:Mg-chelatase subunit ChlD/uncharacterized protein involved in exopolysaccharide biosynthesis